MKAYNKTIFKTISLNLSRYISMMLIILVGICFVTGVGGIVPKIHNSLNEHFKTQNVFDIDIKSTSEYGLPLDLIEDLKNNPSIKNIETITQIDTFDKSTNENIRIYSLDTKNIAINKLTLIEGMYPQEANEILCEQSSKTINKKEIGEEVIVLGQSYKIVGIVKNPTLFYYSGEKSFFNQEYLSSIFYFDSTFNNYFPVTDILIKLNKTDNLSYFDDKYISSVKAEANKITSSINDSNTIALTLNETMSYSGLINITDKIDILAIFFPIFFIAVVALVVLTTLTRLISEERKSIGCYKSLGYSNLRILNKYLFFSLTCSVMGIVLGLISGAYILPNIVYPIFNNVFILPKMTIKINITTGLISSIFMLASILLVTLYVTLKDIKEKPSSLFQPKAPKEGKKILLEHITPIWNMLSFKYKSAYRNIFRYKGRLLMILLSTFGVSALIMAGLGLYNVSQKPIILKGVAYDIGDSIVFISIAIVIFAILLGFLVIYNITNMCISEKNREIATLKVLGYKNTEVITYVYREIISIIVVGILIGIPAGILLLYYIFKSMDFGSIKEIKFTSVIFTVLLVLTFIAIVDLILSRKIIKVNMNDSLKSNE